MVNMDKLFSFSFSLLERIKRVKSNKQKSMRLKVVAVLKLWISIITENCSKHCNLFEENPCQFVLYYN